MSEPAIHIGVLYVDLFIGESLSLKDKRMVLRRLKDKIRPSYNVSMAELDGHDKWQTAMLGFSMIGNDRSYIQSALQSILNLIDGYHAVEICDHQIDFL